MQKWKTLAVEEIFRYGKADKELRIERHKIELPDGQIITDWPWIKSPPYINVLAMTEDSKFICFLQRKYGLEDVSLAPVGGYIEGNENPLEAAKRELLEETGHEAIEWINLGEYRVDPNWGISMGHLFLARAAHYVKPPKGDDLEEQQLVFLNQSELETAFTMGKFKVIAWSALVGLSLWHLNHSRGH